MAEKNTSSGNSTSPTSGKQNNENGRSQKPGITSWLRLRSNSKQIQQAADMTVEQSKVSKKIILILGLSGTGKTTFIRDVTGSSEVAVNHHMQGQFAGIQRYSTSTNHDQCFELVEPPSFDISTSVGDWKLAVGTLCDWVHRLPAKEVEITGILYFHRISDDRMPGSSMRALRLLKALCGNDYMRNVRLVTTHWDLVTEEVGIARVQELRKDYWADMLKHGAEIVQYKGTERESEGRRVLDSFARNEAVELAIQRELVTDGKPWEDTAAGNVLLSEHEKTLRRNQTELLQLVTQLVEDHDNLPNSREKTELMFQIMTLKQQLLGLGFKGDEIPMPSIQGRDGGARSAPDLPKQEPQQHKLKQSVTNAWTKVNSITNLRRTKTDLAFTGEDRKMRDSFMDLVGKMVRKLKLPTSGVQANNQGSASSEGNPMPPGSPITQSPDQRMNGTRRERGGSMEPNDFPRESGRGYNNFDEPMHAQALYSTNVQVPTNQTKRSISFKNSRSAPRVHT